MSKTPEFQGPYEDGSGRAVLRESLVAYIDELGTTDKLKGFSQADLEHDLARYARLLWFLDGDELSEQNSPSGGETRCYVINTFTDNISICRPMPDSGEDSAFELFLFLQGLALYQGNTTISGTLLRGGVAWGEAYAKPGYVTGCAHVEAVFMEEERAKFPRIVLDAKTVKAVQAFSEPEHQQLFKSLLRVDDADGQTYLDYLTFTILENSTERFKVEEVLNKHANLVRKGLGVFCEPSGLRQKYTWLAEYHNYVCNFFKRADLKVSIP